MTTQHTPGPWKVEFCGPHVAEIHVRPHLRVIVDHREDLTDPGADARLIAAAPEMLDNIKDTEAELAGILADPAGIPEPIIELLAELANRQAVLLARIEGKE